MDAADKQDDKEEGTAVNFKNFDSLTPQLEYTLHKKLVNIQHTVYMCMGKTEIV